MLPFAGLPLPVSAMASPSIIKLDQRSIELGDHTHFGRTLAEGMLLGKPVVGTDFSGNTDFLTQDTGYPVKWTRRAVALGGTHSSSPTTKPGGQSPMSAMRRARCGQRVPQRAAPGPCNCRNK